MKLLSAVRAQARETVQGYSAAGGFAIGCAIFGTIGLFYLTWTAYLALLEVLAPVWTSLVIAAAVLAIALILGLIARRKIRRATPSMSWPPSQAATSSPETAQAADPDVTLPTILALAIIGYFAGRNRR